MDTHYHGRLVGRAQQVGWWSLRRLLGRPQRGRHDDNDPQQQQQQQQQQQPGQNAGTAANFTLDWRGIRQGWPAGVTCSHLEESWFAADVVPTRGEYCYCGCGQSVAHRDEEDGEEDEERQRHREEVARATLAEMLHDAVPFALSDGSASGRADPRIVRAARARLLRAFDEDVAGGIREKKKDKKKKKDEKGRRHRRTAGGDGEGAAPQQNSQQKEKHKHKHKHTRPARAFHRFPELPAELRLEIWTLALQGCSRGLGVGVVRAWRYNWHADVPRPALAAVCREARDVVLAATVAVAGGAATGLTVHDRLDLGNSPDGRRLGGLLGCVGRLHGGVVLGLNHFLGRGQAIQDDGLLGLDLGRLAAGAGGGGASLGRVLREVAGGRGAVLVTVQTVYVTLGCGAAAWEGAGGGVEGYLQRLQAIGEFDFVKEVDVAVAEAGEGGLCVDDDDKLDAGMYWRQMIPHEACHHVTEVVPLGDAARMRRILAVGEVTGQWGEGQRGRRPRLLALAHHSHAFCLDACLGAWWRRCGEQTVRAGMERVMRADGLAEEQQQGVVLPEVVPAVRFKIQWPGLEAPKIVDGEVCWEA
ncbi:hypothetical protein MCOR34_006293 [Pyricularia oryzae]|nr:hypothetical protein MCOR34_006293 [Pyricularia oryzae]